MRQRNSRFPATSLMATAFTFAVASLVVCSATSYGQDQIEKASVVQRQVAKTVATLMQRDHLSARQLDDTISERAFDGFIKSLDPMKLYFLQSDMDEFSQWKTEIDDKMIRGDYEVAFSVFNRFLDRVDERVETALELIDIDHDFTVDEELVTDWDAVEFSETKEQVEETWRKRIKYDLLVLRDRDDEEGEGEEESDDDDDEEDPKDLLRKRYTGVANRMHQLDSEDVVEMYVSAITTSFDPHTSYMSSSTFENFLISLQLQLEGIGATLQATDDGYTVIRRIVPGGAADKHGELKVEDKIIGVAQGMEDGTKGDLDLIEKFGLEVHDVTGMKLDDVVGMIRGSAGTVVRLKLSSDDTLKTIAIVREKIDLEDSAAKGRVFELEREGEDTYDIGVIDLPSFYSNMNGGQGGKVRSTTSDVRAILEDFQEKGVDAVVLDLRKNGGGSLREAIDCTGLFIDSGPVVQVKDAVGEIQRHLDEDPGTAWDKPLVVLTSKFSASASEILAGAVQDYQRGLVVGDTTTHGKGTVQNLINLNQLIFKTRNAPSTFGALKITMQQFYRPNGDSTQKRGVRSDITLPSIYDHMDVGESDLDYPVEFDRIPKAQFSAYGMVTTELLEKLRMESLTRVDGSEDFTREKRRIEQYIKQKESKAVSLNEEKFMARRKELSREKADEEAMEDQLNSEGDIERTYYLEEVLRITAGYMDRLENKTIASR